MFKDVTREEKVAQFLRAAGKKTFVAEDSCDWSHYNNVREESCELLDAMVDFVNTPSVENRANLCKEWADVQVVLSNVAWYFNIPADASFNRVHENNMTKVVDGKVIFREDGKILKPEGFQKVDMTGL